MELTNEFEVAVPVDEAWAVLTDIERIAPCMPGAELKEVEGDEYRGVVKVKVGPITASYRGAARFEALDTEHHRAVLKAEGRETRGQGNASATITATLAPNGSGTKVTVVSEIAITGKVAQFGRGVLADVSGKLLDQFVRNLESTVLTPDAATPAKGAPEPAQSAEAPVKQQAPTTKGGAATAKSDKASAKSDKATAKSAVTPPKGVTSSSAGAPVLKGEPPEADAADATPAEASGAEATSAGGPVDDAPAGSGPVDATVISPSDEPVKAGAGEAVIGGTESANGKAAGADAVSPDSPGEQKSDGIRRIQSAPAEPVDLVGVAGSSVAKRLIPFASVAGILVLVRIVVYAMKRRKNFTADDLDELGQITSLLGRPPRGAFEVVVRDAAGVPVVIRNPPLLSDLTPMPTRYWLVGREENDAVGRLESVGGVKQAEAAVDPDELESAHARYAEERDRAIPAGYAGPVPTGGVGGTRRGVKCLHAHVAWYLAGGEDPVGHWATSRLDLRPEHYRSDASGEAPVAR